MKKQQFKPGDIVSIRPAWCDTEEGKLKTYCVIEEGKLKTYCVIEEAGENKYLIQTIGGALMLKPTEVVTGEMLEHITTLEELEERS